MKKPNHQRTALLSVVNGAIADQRTLADKLKGVEIAPVVHFWQEIRPGYYRHEATGQESQCPQGGVNVLFRLFHDDGTPIPATATNEHEPK